MQTPSEYNVLNIDELTFFFRVKNSRINHLTRLIPYLDPEYGNPDNLAGLLENVIINFNDVITQMTILLVLTVWLFYHEEQTLPIARKLFNTIAPNKTPIPINLHAINWSLHFALRRQNPPGKMLELLEDVVWYFWNNSQGRYSTEIRAYKGVVNIIDGYLDSFERKHGHAHYPRLEAHIQAALKNNNFDFVRASLKEISSLGTRSGHPKLALQVLELFLAFRQKEIQDAILTTLAQIRMYYADEVDEFLEIHEFQDNAAAQVKAHTPSETIADIIIIRGAAFAVDALLLEFPEMRSIVQWIFQKALDCSNANQWLELVFMKIANLVYGEELFELSG